MEIIQLEQVSLLRRTQEEFSRDLKRTILSIVEGKYSKPTKRLVLDNVSFSVERGRKIGIIGSNGSGKSTLLKLIAGVLDPTSGKIRVKGQVAPLIELGAGFDLELTVLDNIFLYGILLGFTRADLKQRLGAILEFAELEDYRSMPLKALSSGMMSRLGFAIATDVQPDILILDEVLSVGDERFRTKSQKRIEQLWKADATVLVVSHSMEFIQESCEIVIWLDKGRIQAIGESKAVVDRYLSYVHQPV
jgi:ABC-type polysaccharide/polyol phosphate transport system ATPase subunit